MIYFKEETREEKRERIKNKVKLKMPLEVYEECYYLLYVATNDECAEYLRGKKNDERRIKDC